MFLLKTDRIYLFDGNDEIYIDCYAVDDKRHAPRDAMLVIPGGGYGYVCMDREGEKTALAYTARGINAFVLNYRAGSDDVYPMHLECAVRAMAWIRAHAEEYSVNPERIFAMGYSAGGHLCGTLATQHTLIEEKLGLVKNTARPLGIVMCYPVVSAFEPTHKDSFHSLLNKPYEELSYEEKRMHSVECNITKDTCPAFIWHTAEDNAVPVHNSLRLAMAYADAGVGFALHVYPYGPHAICLGKDFCSAGPQYSDRIQPLAETWLEDSIKWMETVK